MIKLIIKPFVKYYFNIFIPLMGACCYAKNISIIVFLFLVF